MSTIYRVSESLPRANPLWEGTAGGRNLEAKAPAWTQVHADGAEAELWPNPQP